MWLGHAAVDKFSVRNRTSLGFMAAEASGFPISAPIHKMPAPPRPGRPAGLLVQPRQGGGFSKKVENHTDMVALYTVCYNFVRQHKTLRCSPAMAAGLSTTLWSMEDVVKLIDVRAAKPNRPATYKTAAKEEISN